MQGAGQLKRGNNLARILVTSCSHAPCMLPQFPKFLEKVYAKYNCNRFIHLGDLVDNFVEMYMGKYGRVEFSGGEGSITLKNTDTLELNNFLNSNIDWLKSLNEKLKSDKDSDLLNLRDEMMGEINKLKYLLTLK